MHKIFPSIAHGASSKGESWRMELYAHFTRCHLPHLISQPLFSKALRLRASTAPFIWLPTISIKEWESTLWLATLPKLLAHTLFRNLIFSLPPTSLPVLAPSPHFCEHPNHSCALRNCLRFPSDRRLDDRLSHLIFWSSCKGQVRSNAAPCNSYQPRARPSSAGVCFFDTSFNCSVHCDLSQGILSDSFFFPLWNCSFFCRSSPVRRRRSCS